MGGHHELRIGRKGGTNTNNFNGLLDDVRIYSRALSADEVNNLYEGGYASGTGSTTWTLGSALSLSGSLSIDSGVFNANGNTEIGRAHV